MGNGAWHTHHHPLWLMRIPETDVGLEFTFCPALLLVARLYQLGLCQVKQLETSCLSLSSGYISANYIHKHSSDCSLVTRHNGVIATVTSQLGAAISFPRESTWGLAHVCAFQGWAKCPSYNIPGNASIHANWGRLQVHTSECEVWLFLLQ